MIDPVHAVASVMPGPAVAGRVHTQPMTCGRQFVAAMPPPDDASRAARVPEPRSVAEPPGHTVHRRSTRVSDAMRGARLGARAACLPFTVIYDEILGSEVPRVIAHRGGRGLQPVWRPSPVSAVIAQRHQTSRRAPAPRRLASPAAARRVPKKSHRWRPAPTTQTLNTGLASAQCAGRHSTRSPRRWRKRSHCSPARR